MEGDQPSLDLICGRWADSRDSDQRYCRQLVGQNGAEQGVLGEPLHRGILWRTAKERSPDRFAKTVFKLGLLINEHRLEVVYQQGLTDKAIGTVCVRLIEIEETDDELVQFDRGAVLICEEVEEGHDVSEASVVDVRSQIWQEVGEEVDEGL